MKIFERLKCDPECQHRWWKCLWDSSPLWPIIHSGPLWWLCSDCRWIRRNYGDWSSTKR